MENNTHDPQRFQKQIAALRDKLEQLSREPNDASRLAEARRLMLELNRAELLSQAARRTAGARGRIGGPVTTTN